MLTTLAAAAVFAAALPWLVVLFRTPTVLVVAALAAVIYARTIVRLTGVGALGNLDDIAVAAVVLCGVMLRLGASPTRSRRSFPGLAFFLAFGAMGVASGVVAGVPMTITLAASWLALKGVAFGWAVAQMEWRRADLAFLTKAAAINGLLICAALLPNAAAPGAWARVFSGNGETINRYGLPSLLGPFVHPFDLAVVSAFTLIGVVCYRRHVAKTPLSTVLLVGMSVAVVGSLRRKDLIGTLLGVAVVGLRERRWGPILLGAVVGMGVAVAASGPIITQVDVLRDTYFRASSKEARTVLTVQSIKVAKRHAPLGAGFGRYGSRQAAVNYSPEYDALGFRSIYGLGPGPEAGVFLTDTGWPAIVGEAGFIGALFFVLGFGAMLRHVLRSRRTATEPHVRMLGATALGCFVVYAFESTGGPVFTSPPEFPLLFGLVGILAAAGRTDNAPSGLAIEPGPEQAPASARELSCV